MYFFLRCVYMHDLACSFSFVFFPGSSPLSARRPLIAFSFLPRRCRRACLRAHARASVRVWSPCVASSHPKRSPRRRQAQLCSAHRPACRRARASDENCSYKGLFRTFLSSLFSFMRMNRRGSWCFLFPRHVTHRRRLARAHAWPGDKRAYAQRRHGVVCVWPQVPPLR
jgi:hypothetical protein